MDDLAHPVHVVKADKALPGESARKRHGHTLVVVPLDDLEEVDAQDFKHHHEVLSIGTMMDE